ncbi:MAG: hypothetical protein IPP13_17125 [Kouleothrix sp.]|jgi:hypothetical protein|nr:hypothetical protein [Kouleothrix sp.]
MTNNRKNRLPSDEVQADRNALQGLQTLADYAPANGAYSLHTLTTLGEAMEEARNAEVRAMQALAAARAATTAAEWALHEGILGARAQVVAQYGHDAPAVQLLGLKRKSERRRRAVARASATT